MCDPSILAELYRNCVDNAHYKRGHETGSEWSTHIADMESVENLEHMRNEIGSQWPDYFYSTEGDERSPAYRLLSLTHPGYTKADFAAREALRQQILLFVDRERDLERPMFVLGFADGALDVWNKIKEEF